LEDERKEEFMEKKEAKKKKLHKLSFEYKISPTYTVYAINGAYGGITPHGEILMSVFNERTAIPQTETYQINEDGSLGEKPSDQVKKDSIIRHVMFGLSMNPNVARSLAKWLNSKADAYEERLKGAKKSAKKGVKNE
jgi:hypothetical protein